MPAFNLVVLMGNLTRDPQLKYLPSQTACTEFGIAINKKWRSEAGEDREDVCFVDCVAFGKTAELVNQYLTKGNPIHLQGSLKFEQWEDKQGGGKRSKLKVVVERVHFIGNKQQGDGGDDAQAEPDPHPRRRNTVGWSGGGSSPAGRPSTAAREHVDPIGDEKQFKEDDIPF